MERRAFEGSAAEKGWHHRGGRRMKTPGEDPSVRTEGVTNGGKKISCGSHKAQEIDNSVLP